MDIGNYYIGGYWWLFKVKLSLAINGYWGVTLFY